MEYNQPPKLQCSKSYLRKKEQGRDLKKQHSNLVIYEKKKKNEKKKEEERFNLNNRPVSSKASRIPFPI